ncbi:hypothetical protein GUJ93_ZPchr0013g37925 [Zizania palustris]|uniref:Uncharacterized protein n=1 Tax=Zizania palustris TaxID=103762 RepID=A0A8J5X3I3_ZIZPA|nr:hypothetical protein GUJ93_ZPchr0013g37925 [Zizania palustris]
MLQPLPLPADKDGAKPKEDEGYVGGGDRDQEGGDNDKGATLPVTRMVIAAMATTVAPPLGMHNASRTRRELGHVCCVVAKGATETPAPLSSRVAMDCIVVGGDHEQTRSKPLVKGKPVATHVT